MKLLIVIVILYSSGALASSPSAVTKNNDAVNALEQEMPGVAYKKLVEALGDEPFNPVIKLNLGFTFEINEAYDQAFKEYVSASKVTKDKQLKFYAFFNAASVSALDKNVDRALKYYQMALENDPGSVEVKTNIELLTSQQGEGEGEGGGEGDQENDEKKDGEGEGDQKKEPKDDGESGKEKKPKKPQPKNFKSPVLTENDVRKILEELKNQEQKIRAKEYQKGAKERTNGKDW